MSSRNMISRRQLLGTMAAGCPSLLTPWRARAADAPRRVSMRLDYPYQGPSVGFLVAREKGFYKDLLLDVDVGPGKGGANTAQLVASKAVDFGFADGFVVGTGVSKGLDIRMVAAIYRRNPAAVIVLANSDIKTPKDLEGRTIAMPAGGGTFQQWPAYVKGSGLDGSKVRVVNIDPSANVPTLLTGRSDAIAGFPMTIVPDIELRGKTTARSLWFADSGVDIVSNGILVHNDLIKSDPDLVRRFVLATLKGFLYARQHSEEAGVIVNTYLPSIDPEIARRQVELSWQTWITPNTKGQPIGWMAEKDWEKTVDLLKQVQGTGTTPGAGLLYTNAFVPTGPEFVPPQS